MTEKKKFDKYTAHGTEERKLEFRRSEFAKDTRKHLEELRRVALSCFKPDARLSSDLVEDINHVGWALDNIQDELSDLIDRFDHLHDDGGGL